jgi:hypothetical protein
MVKLISVACVGLATLASAVAHAQPPDPDDYVEDTEQVEDDDSPAFNMFGFAMGIGAMPHDGARTLAVSLGVSVEHPVFRKTRVALEYDWLWLTRQDERAQMSATPRPERHASGHRAAVALRRELIAKGAGKARMFVDGELGANVALANDNMAGVEVIPGVFTGLRAGYDLYTQRDASPSRTFETAFLLRAFGVRDGIGLTFGFGMYWGN